MMRKPLQATTPRPRQPVATASTAPAKGEVSPQADRNQVQVIARAAAILRAIEARGAGMSLGQIAQAVGLARSTVQRIVNALETEQLLISGDQAGSVALGPALLRLAGSVRSDIVDLVRPHLLRLSADLHETVDLAAIRRNRLVFIDQVVGSQRLRTVSAVGESFPLYCTANGKAYLSTLDDRGIERLLGSELEPRTPHTLTQLPQLLSDIARTRRAGIAYDREEHTLGICAAGIAFVDPSGNAHAISVPVPAARFARSEAKIAARLLRLRAELNDTLDGLRRT